MIKVFWAEFAQATGDADCRYQRYRASLPGKWGGCLNWTVHDLRNSWDER